MTINEEAVTSDDAGRTAILDFIKDAPELANFDYRPWNDEQRNKVMGVLSQFSNPGTSIETVTRKQAAPDPVKAEAATETVTAAPTATKTEDSSKGDDFDDFINGLDL